MKHSWYSPKTMKPTSTATCCPRRQITGMPQHKMLSGSALVFVRNVLVQRLVPGVF